MQNTEKVQNITKAIHTKLNKGFSPLVGVVLGTGLGDLVTDIKGPIRIPYTDLLEFPISTATSHEGCFVFGTVQQTPVVFQSGRCHLYEGRSPKEVSLGVRVMHALGVKSLILTNAAGSVNPLFPSGGLMVIDDHINFTGQSPLIGENDDSVGVPFPDMSRIYDAKLIKLTENIALKMGILLHTGVYLGLIGPQLETRAETRALRMLGADAVGMSTVIEAIAAHHAGIKLLGISSLTNQNLPDAMEETSIENIIEAAKNSSKNLKQLIRELLPLLAEA